MKTTRKVVVSALASCAFIGLAACSSASSPSTAASAPAGTATVSASSACSAMLDAIGPYATEKFSLSQAKVWADQIVSVTGTQITSLSVKAHGSASTAKKLLSDENSLYNDALVLENAAAGHASANSKGKKAVPGDVISVTGDIKHVYADCGQTMP